MKLKTKYNKIVEQYLKAFVEKQELDIDNCYLVALNKLLKWKKKKVTK